MTVVCVGETMGAVRMRGPLRLGGAAEMSTAGSESNVAIGLARLGTDAAWVGVVGDDELGALVLRTLRAEAVDCSAARIDGERPTGLIVFEPLPGGRRRALYHRRGSAGSTVCADDVGPALHPGLRGVFTSGITLALGTGPAGAARAALARGRDEGALTCLAVNHRAALQTRAQGVAALDAVLEHVDVLVAAESALTLAAGDEAPRSALDTAAAAVLGRGPREVVVTRGAGGASVYTAAGRIDRAAVATEVVDPVGAGDAFTAGYLSGRLAGDDPAAALARGVVVGACCVGTAGDWEGLPTARELALAAREPGDVLR